MKWSDHIIGGPDAGSRPVIKRTRVAVEQVFANLGAGASTAELDLLPEELAACFNYASEVIPNRLMQRADPGDSKIHVTEGALAKAFQRHVQTARQGTNGGAQNNDSYLLLLVYGIECGLKRLLLKRRGDKSTSQLDRDDLTHDLDELLKLLGQPPRFRNTKLQQPEEDVVSGRIHEAMRYGRLLVKTSRSHVITQALEVASWIEEQFS